MKKHMIATIKLTAAQIAAIERELTSGNRVELVPVKNGARLYQVRRKELNKENIRTPA